MNPLITKLWVQKTHAVKKKKPAGAFHVSTMSPAAAAGFGSSKQRAMWAEPRRHASCSARASNLTRTEAARGDVLFRDPELSESTPSLHSPSRRCRDRRGVKKEAATGVPLFFFKCQKVSSRVRRAPRAGEEGSVNPSVADTFFSKARARPAAHFQPSTIEAIRVEGCRVSPRCPEEGSLPRGERRLRQVYASRKWRSKTEWRATHVHLVGWSLFFFFFSPSLRALRVETPRHFEKKHNPGFGFRRRCEACWAFPASSPQTTAHFSVFLHNSIIRFFLFLFFKCWRIM